MLSLVTVNWNSYEFLKLLIESIERFTNSTYELIVIDNSVEKQTVQGKNIKYHATSSNVGHGEGLNLGVKMATFPYIVFLDVDTHFLTYSWESKFLEKMQEFDVIGGKGVPVKPIRPACLFMKKEFAHYDWNPTENYKGHRITPQGRDVAITAYYQMIEDGVRIGFLDTFPNHYNTATGEIWGIDGIPLIYHQWHGSHLTERQIDFEIDLQKEKEKLFSQITWRLP